MRTSSWLLVVAGALSLPLQAKAQDAETTADVRCIAVGIRVPASLQQSTGTMVVLYFLGRLDGRVPKLDLEDLLTKEISRMTATDYVSEAVRCGGALTLRGQQLVQIGKNMTERGQKMLGKPTK